MNKVMNKTVVLILFLACIILPGCSDSKISSEQQSSVFNSVGDSGQNSKYDDMETLTSDDGKIIITVYTERETGINRIIEKIVVSDDNGSFEINDVIGYYGTMRWALGQSKAVIEYYGREWRDFIIIDTEKKEVMFKESFTFQEFMDYFKKQGIVFNYTVNKNRPDIEYKLNKMIDEDNIRIDYIVHDENYVTQSGSFNYNLSKGTFSELTQNEPKVEG